MYLNTQSQIGTLFLEIVESVRGVVSLQMWSLGVAFERYSLALFPDQFFASWWVMI